MDDILDNIDFDIENNRTVFLKESDPFLPEERWLFSPAPVLTSEHAKLDNSKIGLNLTDTTDKRRKYQHLEKGLPDQNL